MSEVIKTARSININNISVHLNDNEKNIEIVAEYDELDYKSVMFPLSDWESVKSAIEDLLENGGTDEWVKKPEAKTPSSVIGFDRVVEVAELQIKTDMIVSLAAQQNKHPDTTSDDEAELLAIVNAASKKYQDEISTLPASMAYAVRNFNRNK